MEFSISAVVNRIADDAAVVFSVAINLNGGFRSVHNGVTLPIAPEIYRAGAAIVDLKVVRYIRGVQDALAGDTHGSRACRRKVQYHCPWGVYCGGAIVPPYRNALNLVPPRTLLTTFFPLF